MVGQPRAGWEVAEPGGRVFTGWQLASRRGKKVKDARGVGSEQGQGQSYHVLLPTVDHGVSPGARDEETDPAFVGGALRGRTGAILSIYHKVLETNDDPRLMGPQGGWQAGSDLESYSMFNLKHQKKLGRGGSGYFCLETKNKTLDR